MQEKKLRLLYAEDDIDDFESMKDAIGQLTDDFELIHARNGTEVVSFLENAENSLPCLLILDLNMPIMNGKEVLMWVKDRDQFENLPVLIFTTSSRQEDVRLCQNYKCSFFRKPTLYRDLLHVAQTILDMCGDPNMATD